MIIPIEKKPYRTRVYRYAFLSACSGTPDLYIVQLFFKVIILIAQLMWYQHRKRVVSENMHGILVDLNLNTSSIANLTKNFYPCVELMYLILSQLMRISLNTYLINIVYYNEQSSEDIFRYSSYRFFIRPEKVRHPGSIVYTNTGRTT